jgi:hypothetical protein
MRKLALFPSLALLALSLAAGCSSKRVTMQDDFDLDLFGPYKDDLHSPYVVGASFGISVDTHDKTDTSGWTLQSSAPGVIEVESTPSASTSPSGSASTSPPRTSFDIPVKAVAAGHATLTVRDAKGNVVDTHDVDVEVPDRVELYAHGLLLAGESDDQARVNQVHVLPAGEGTFLVRYFVGGTELTGSGALAPSASGAATATSTHSGLAPSRDWLQVTGTGDGTGQVSLVVGGAPLGMVPVTIADPTSIASVALAKQDDSHSKDGDLLYVFARSLDAQGNDVYGASFSWKLDGNPLAPHVVAGEPTDVISYQYKSGSSDSITTQFTSMSTSVNVHANPSTVAVGSTASVGCSVGAAPGAAGGAGLAGLAACAAGVALVATRRRRSSRS